MIKIYDSNLKLVNRSQNLRGVFDRASKITVSHVHIWRDAGKQSCQVGVTWADDSSAIFSAESYSVMLKMFTTAKNFKSASMNVKG